MPFAISGGRLARVERPAQAAWVPTTVRLSDRVTVEYAEIYRAQPQVRTVVDFLARNIAQLGLHVYRRVSDLDRKRVTDHPLAQLLSRPNPHTTPYRFMSEVVSDMAIYDNAVVVKVAFDGQPRGLQRVDPRRVTLKGDNPFRADAYEITGPRDKVTVPADQVIHLRGYSSTDERWGSSPLEALRGILAEDYQAQVYREQLWRNGARVSGYLERPIDAPSWSKEGKDKFRDQWQAQYAGDGAKPGGTPILEDGMRYVPAGTTPRDAQYAESRKLTREEVTAAYHIPLTLVGILDNATYSNISEQHKMMYQDTLAPWLTMIQQELELQLVPDFVGTRNLYIEFNLAEKLRGSFEEQAAQLQTAVGAPWMSRNEARARVNLPQVDGGDELITPLNVLEGGQASPTDSAPKPPEAGEEQAPVAPKAHLRAVEAN
ncbi:MAG: phage portal protein [Actinomycetota bacterium]|nr:phage portal protein [Actinomycetota bacterium]